MNRGHTRTTKNALTGSAQGIDVCIFDYSYTSGSGKNRTTRTATVAFFRAPGMRLPAFTLQPEGFFNKLGGLFGMQDIDFPAHPEFSSAFLLRGTDEPAIRTLFDAGLMTAMPSLKKICVEGGGDRLIVFRSSKRTKPELIPAFLEETFRAFCHFSDAARRNGLADASPVPAA